MKNTKEQIANIFNQGYRREKWLELLNQTFNLEAFSLTQTILLTDGEKQFVNSVQQLGTIKLPDEKAISVFEVEIKPQIQLHRNRTQLRNLIAGQRGIQEGALAVYYDKSKNKWRFSFIRIEYQLKEDGEFTQKQTSTKRYTYLLGEEEKIRTATDQFSELNQKSTLEDIQKAFSVEPLNKEFYGKLYNWYEQTCEKVTFPNDEKQKEHNKNSLIRLLTRLLFVWFIKQKNLINADFFDQDKLKNLIDWEKPSSYYKAILQNLFFATLNQEIKKRSFRTTTNGKANSNNYLMANVYRYRIFFKEDLDEQNILTLFKKTPFLNGGLFECLDREATDEEKQNYEQDKSIRNESKAIRIEGFSDRRDNKLQFDNQCFFNDDENNLGLIDLLHQYQFTIDESTSNDIDIALDPELLGKVFENLLATNNKETGEQARKATGSFYTPREIVSYMVDESIKAHFKQHPDLTEKEITELFEEDTTNPLNEKNTKQLIDYIDKLKILDPAVGSGAFPMGILQRLTTILQKIDPENKYWKEQQLKVAEQIPDEESKIASIKSINNIFSQENNFNSYGHKLFLIEKAIYGVDTQPIAIQICKLRFFISLTIEQNPTDNKENNYGIKALPNLETKFIASNSLISLKGLDTLSIFDGKTQELQGKLKEIRSQYFNAKTPQTKQKYRDKDKETREKIKQELIKTNDSSATIAQKIAYWNPYDQTTDADWFSPKWQFGIEGGFDIVLGNPPYIQLQKEDGKLGKLYQNEKYKSFAKTGDIYCLFYERGHQLLNNKGHLCFITSNKWMRAGYGKQLRNYFVNNIEAKILLDLGPGIFESATVDTNILLFAKEKAKQPKPIKALSIKNKEQAQNLEKLDLIEIPVPKNDDSWIILSKEKQEIKNKIEKIGTPLKDWDIEINYGIKTGYNEAFIIDTAKRDELVAQDPKSAEIIKPILRGKDIKRYQANWAGKWLIATHNGYTDKHNSMPAININDYSAVKQHLDKYWVKIEKRQDKGSTPYNLRNCAYYSAFAEEKIVYPNMTTDLPFILDSTQYLTNQKCFILTGKNLNYLLSVFNSKIIGYWIKQTLPELGSGWELSKIFMNNLPIPQISEKEQQPFIELVEKILTAKEANPNADTNQWEEEIDQLVYKLYQLNDREIALIV